MQSILIEISRWGLFISRPHGIWNTRWRELELRERNALVILLVMARRRPAFVTFSYMSLISQTKSKNTLSSTSHHLKMIPKYVSLTRI